MKRRTLNRRELLRCSAGGIGWVAMLLDRKNRLQKPEFWRQGDDQTQKPPTANPRAKQLAQTPPRQHHRPEYHSMADLAPAEDEDAYETPGDGNPADGWGGDPGTWGADRLRIEAMVATKG